MVSKNDKKVDQKISLFADLNLSRPHSLRIGLIVIIRFDLADPQHIVITILLGRVALTQSLRALPSCLAPRVHFLKIQVQFIVECLIDPGLRLLLPNLGARLGDYLLIFRFIVYLLVFIAPKLPWGAGMEFHNRSLLVLEIV